MSKRLLIASAGILTGIFLAGWLRAEVHPPKLVELEEFRAVLGTMVHIALPENDFVYIAARKTRLETARKHIAKLKLPESLKHREKEFKKARKYFLKVTGRFIDVMRSDKYSIIRERILKADTAFALLYVSLGGPPTAVDEFAAAAAPLAGDKKHPPQIPPAEDDVAALRRATENLLNTKIDDDYCVVRQQFDREREMAVQAVKALGPTMAEGDSVKIDAAMRGIAASSRRLATIFQPRK